MKVGDFVKYNRPNGSIGKIIDVNHPYHVCVQWVYGKDKLEELMVAHSNCLRQDLVPITEQEYVARAERKGFSS